MTAGKTMMAVVTTGNGGYDKLDYREVATPIPGQGEVLLRVLAAGVEQHRDQHAAGLVLVQRRRQHRADRRRRVRRRGRPARRRMERGDAVSLHPGHRLLRPRRGGRPGGDERLVGKRVLVRACMRRAGFESLETVWMGSDFDGAFAQWVKVPEGEVFPVESAWSDAELATIPCAYGTAEHAASGRPRRGRTPAGDRRVGWGGLGGGAAGEATRRDRDRDCGTCEARADTRHRRRP